MTVLTSLSQEPQRLRLPRTGWHAPCRRQIILSNELIVANEQQPQEFACASVLMQVLWPGAKPNLKVWRFHVCVYNWEDKWELFSPFAVRKFGMTWCLYDSQLQQWCPAHLELSCGYLGRFFPEAPTTSLVQQYVFINRHNKRSR